MVLKRLGPGLELFQCGICQERFSVLCDFFKHFEEHRELLSNSNIDPTAACPLKGYCWVGKNKKLPKHQNTDTATAADILADLHNLVHVVHNPGTKTSDISFKEDDALSPGEAAKGGLGIKCAVCREEFPTLCAVREHLKNRSFYFFESIRTCIPQTLSCSLSAIKSEVFMSVVLRKADERQEWIKPPGSQKRFSSEMKEKVTRKTQKSVPNIPNNQNKCNTNSVSTNNRLQSGLVESVITHSDNACINSQNDAEIALTDHGYSTILLNARVFDHEYSAIDYEISDKKGTCTSKESTANTEVFRQDGESSQTGAAAEELGASYQDDGHSDGENSVDNSVDLSDIKQEVFDRNTVAVVPGPKIRTKKQRKKESAASLFLQRQKRKIKTVCENCGMSVSRGWLMYHVKLCSTGKQYPCNICGAIFAISGALFNHRRTVHLKEYSHQCEMCGYLGNSEQNLAKHMVNHGVKKHICSVCGKGFRHAPSLKLHEKMHSGVRDFLCSECGWAFYSTWNLKRHMLTHQDNLVATPSSNPVSVPDNDLELGDPLRCQSSNRDIAPENDLETGDPLRCPSSNSVIVPDNDLETDDPLRCPSSNSVIVPDNDLETDDPIRCPSSNSVIDPDNDQEMGDPIRYPSSNHVIAPDNDLEMGDPHKCQSSKCVIIPDNDLETDLKWHQMTL